MTQDLYQKVIKFASLKHSEIKLTIIGTNIPYIAPLSNVAMELIINQYLENRLYLKIQKYEKYII